MQKKLKKEQKMTTKKVKNSKNPLDKELLGLFQAVKDVHQRAIKEIKQNIAPEIDSIIISKQKNCLEIERILDILLDFAFDEYILGLFKKLCRYYFSINAEATIFYVHSYRELWDNKEN